MGRVHHAAEGEGEEWVRSSLLMREHGVIFACSEADELRMLDHRRTIWDNDTVEKKEWKWILCIVSW